MGSVFLCVDFSLERAAPFESLERFAPRIEKLERCASRTDFVLREFRTGCALREVHVIDAEQSCLLGAYV